MRTLRGMEMLNEKGTPLAEANADYPDVWSAKGIDDPESCPKMTPLPTITKITVTPDDACVAQGLSNHPHNLTVFVAQGDMPEFTVTGTIREVEDDVVVSLGQDSPREIRLYVEKFLGYLWFLIITDDEETYATVPFANIFA